MNKVSIGQSLTFSFSTFFGNIIFFIKGFFVTAFIALVGVAISILLSLPFIIPVFSKMRSIQDLFFSKGLSLEVIREALSIISGGILIIVFATFVLGILLKMVYDYIILGWYRVSVDFCKKGTSSVSRLFSRISTLFKYFFANLVIFIIIFLVFLLSFFACLIIYYLISKITGVPVLIGIQSFYSLLKSFLVLPALVPVVYLAVRFVFYIYFIADKNSGIFESISKSFRASTGHVIRLLIVLSIFSVIDYALRMFFFRSLGLYAIPFVIFAFLLVKIWSIFAVAFFYYKLTSPEV